MVIVAWLYSSNLLFIPYHSNTCRSNSRHWRYTEQSLSCNIQKVQHYFRRFASSLLIIGSSFVRRLIRSTIPLCWWQTRDESTRTELISVIVEATMRFVLPSIYLKLFVINYGYYSFVKTMPSLKLYSLIVTYIPQGQTGYYYIYLFSILYMYYFNKSLFNGSGKIL